jgi:serine/threonine-protein kinase RsbW
MQQSVDTVPAGVVWTAEPSWLLRYTRSYPGRPDQIRLVRSFLREVLADWPRADDAVTIASELATNSVLHSRSGAPGGTFSIRAEVSGRACTCISVHDNGGHWELGVCEVQPEHGLDVVEAMAGPGNWGITGDSSGHLVWACLPWADPGDVPASLPGHAHQDRESLVDLEKLSAELGAHGLPTRLVTQPGKIPYLEVGAPHGPAAPERVYAQADWYFWPTAERIAARDDQATAARTIAHTLRTHPRSASSGHDVDHDRENG